MQDNAVARDVNNCIDTSNKSSTNECKSRIAAVAITRLVTFIRGTGWKKNVYVNKSHSLEDMPTFTLLK
jgi:hypothetical protein